MSTPAPDVVVYPHLRSHSLLTIGDRRIELPLPAGAVRTMLNGGEAQLADGENDSLTRRRAVDLCSGLARLLAAPAVEAGAVPRAIVHVVAAPGDDIIVRAIEQLTPAFAALGLEFVSQEDPLNREPVAATTVILAVSSHLHAEWALELERRAFASKAVFCAFWLTSDGAAYGPLTSVDGPVGLTDLFGRWITSAADEAVARSMLREPAFNHRATRPPVDILWALTTCLADLARWWAEPDAAFGLYHVRVSPHRFTVERDPVLPLPLNPRDTATPASALPDPVAAVVSPRTGIVTRLRPVRFATAMPRGLQFVESQTADMARLGSWASNIFNAGSAWDDATYAERGAVGEAIERYCGNVVDYSALVRASFHELTRRGVPAIDPRSLVLFSQEQYRFPGFPFVSFDEDLPVSWTPARSLVTGEEVLAPASLVYVNWNTGASQFDPPTNPAFYPGIAAAPQRELALCNALEEVVERDAAMVWWLSGADLATEGDQPALQRLRERIPIGRGLRLHALTLPTGTALPVTAVVVEDDDNEIATLGLACRHLTDRAVDKAALEAFGLLESALDLQRPDGGFWSAHEAQGGGAQAVKSIRSDRRYLDSYRADYRDVTDLFCQLQIQLDPRALRHTRPRWSGSTMSRPAVDLPERAVAHYVDRLTAAGFEPFEVDLTTPDARIAGWHAVRVLVPGMVPNFPTAFPPLGRQRVLQEPVRLGLFDEPLDREKLCRFPMPYA